MMKREKQVGDQIPMCKRAIPHMPKKLNKLRSATHVRTQITEARN